MFENLENSKHEKIIDVLRKMARTDHYYYEFFMFVNFLEVPADSDIDTLAVTANKNGLVLLWNRKFIDSLDLEQLRFCLFHELFHLIWKHIDRRENRNHRLSNITMDQLINSTILNDSYLKSITKKPMAEIFEVPKEYNDTWVFEKLYSWNLKNNKNEENGENEENEKNGENGENGKNGDGKQNKKRLVDTHIEKTPEEEIWEQSHIDDIKNSLSARGIEETEAVKQILEMSKPSVDYIRKIKTSIQDLKGLKKTSVTYMRPNKRSNDNLILKGSKKQTNFINVVVDTSGSMWSNSTIDKILKLLFVDDVILNVIQADTEIKKIDLIKNKKELKNFKISGAGGTQLQPALDYLKKIKTDKPVLVLTDGETDVLDFSGLKNKNLIISSNVECPISSGNVKQILIDVDKI